MANPMHPSASNGVNGYKDLGQVQLGSAIEQRIPCVAATSHNDEMQAVPFTHALSLGITSIESDTWLIDGVMLAGHELKDCSKDKTFKGVYLDPVYDMLEKANVNSERLQKWDSNDWKGVFSLDPKQELMLMIDIKNDAEASFYKSLELLQPFIEKNYLTVYRDGKLVPGPVTIVGTGDTPIPLVLAASPRYIFYDAPLVGIEHPITAPDGSLIEWGSEIAPIASSKWIWWNYLPNVTALKVLSDKAHAKGIKARWWGVARWPGYFRRALWDLQLRAEVDILNADDLADVAAFLRKKEDKKRRLQAQANKGQTTE